MKKRYWAVPLAVAAIGAGAAVYAADLANLNGQGCPAGYVGNYHFVNNQVPAGSPAGTLTAQWDGGAQICQIGPSKILSSVQHFNCIGYEGTLTSASTDLGGRLLLSDYSCTAKKCDPKVEKCD